MESKKRVNKVLQTFGDNVLTQRKKIQLNQEDVANVLGVSRVTIANIEAGRNRTTIEHILRLCALFKCTPNELMPPVPTIDLKSIIVKKRVVETKALKAKFTWTN